MRISKCSFCSNNSLGDGGLRCKEGARNFLSCQASQQTKRQRNTRFRRENRMAGDEDKAQQVIANGIIQSGIEVRHGTFLFAQLATEFLMLAIKQLISAEIIDCAMLGRRHEPSAWILGNSRLWPLLERSHQSVLRKVFSNTYVTHHARERADQPGRFDSPD